MPPLNASSDHPLPQLSGRIMVVDDEPSVLAIAAAILNTIDISPLKARNGEEALEIARSLAEQGQEISIAILDLTMPGGISGFETLEALRDIHPTVRVIACSGFFEEGALELCLSIGFSNILAKPYTPDSLLGMIRRTQNEAPPPRLQTRASTPPPAPAPLFRPAPFVAAAAAPAASPSPSPVQFEFDSDLLDESRPEEVTPASEPAPAAADAPPVPGPMDTPHLTGAFASPEPASAAVDHPKKRPFFLASALARGLRVRGRDQESPPPSNDSATSRSE
jgi:CheY-like chemotaxis protein